MTDHTAFFKSEIAYRSHRIRSGTATRRRGRVRSPWGRQPAEASDRASDTTR